MSPALYFPVCDDMHYRHASALPTLKSTSNAAVHFPTCLLPSIRYKIPIQPSLIHHFPSPLNLPETGIPNHG